MHGTALSEMDEECESDDPVEFLEHDRGGLSELYFHDSGPAAEDSESEEEQKNSFSKFSHDLIQDSKEKRRRKQSQQREDDFSSSVISTTIHISGGSQEQTLLPTQDLSENFLRSATRSAPRNRSAMKQDIDRPKHWNNSTMTPIRAKRPLSSQKTPRKNESTPVTTPRSVQSPAGQLSFRPNFLKTPESVPPLLLDADDDVDLSRMIPHDLTQSSRRTQHTSPHRSEEKAGRGQNRRFREGSLSNLFQQILKEQESLELQFLISLPRFPIDSEHLESTSDLQNPRTRTKHWGDLSLRSVVDGATGVFLVWDMEVTAVSSNYLNQLQPGSRVRTHLRRDRMQELGINVQNFRDKTLRVYDFCLLPLGTNLAPSDQVPQSAGLGDDLPPLQMLCTQLCEVLK